MKIIKKIWSHVDKNVLIILLVAAIILSPIFTGKYTKGHDTFYHFSNISILTESINFSEGKWFPDKVVPIAVNDFGLGEGIFYPSLPHYFTAYLYKGLSHFGMNVLTVMNIAHLFVLFLSGLGMYFLVRKISKNNMAGLVSSIIYMTFPYLFLDMCIRDAYAETFLFMFVPLIFLGLQYLFEQNYRKFYIWFIIGFVGSINSHLVLSIYIIIFVIIFFLFNIKKILNKKTILSLFISAFVIFGFCAPFIIPLAEHMLFGDYAVYQDGFMWNNDMILNSRVGILDYLSLPSKIGIIYLTTSFIGVLCFLLVIFNKDRIKDFEIIKNYSWMALITFIIMLPIIPWNLFPKFLLSIQFVWRLQLLLMFFISVVAGFSVMLFKKDFQKNVCIIIGVIAIFSVCNLYTYTYVGYLDSNKINISEGARASYEYLPSTSVSDIDYLYERGNQVIILSGKAKVKNIVSNTPSLRFDIETKGAKIEIPRLYYLGYKIILKDKSEQKVLNYSESKDGFISFDVPKNGSVSVGYVGTNGYKIAIMLFIISLLCSIMYLIRNRKNQ